MPELPKMVRDSLSLGIGSRDSIPTTLVSVIEQCLVNDYHLHVCIMSGKKRDTVRVTFGKDQAGLPEGRCAVFIQHCAVGFYMYANSQLENKILKGSEFCPTIGHVLRNLNCLIRYRYTAYAVEVLDFVEAYTQKQRVYEEYHKEAFRKLIEQNKKGDQK